MHAFPNEARVSHLGGSTRGFKVKRPIFVAGEFQGKEKECMKIKKKILLLRSLRSLRSSMAACRFCGKVVKTKLWEHERIHKDAFKKGIAYLCQPCEVGFHNMDLLNDHKRFRCPHKSPPPKATPMNDGDFLNEIPLQSPMNDDGDFLGHFNEMEENLPDSPEEMGQEFDEGDLFDWLSGQPDLDLPKGDGNAIFQSREDLLMYLIFEGSGLNKVCILTTNEKSYSSSDQSSPPLIISDTDLLCQKAALVDASSPPRFRHHQAVQVGKEV